MLLGNHSVLNKSLARWSSGTATAGAYAGQTRSNFKNPSIYKGRYNTLDKRASEPQGYEPGNAFLMPRSAGGMATTNRIQASGALTASAIRARRSQSTIPGVGSVTANLRAIVPGAATIPGVGSVTASLKAVSNVAASISGLGSVSANLRALVPLNSSISGVASLSPNLKGRGSLSAEITTVTALSPQGLSDELLNNQDIETGYSLREALRLVLSATAGKLSGAAGTTITIRNVPDTKDRIVATVDSNGNRTSVTYDVED